MKLVKRCAALLLLALAACGGQDDGDAGLTQTEAGLFSLFDPVAASPTIPFPFDGLFSGFTDPTLNIPNSGAVPFVTAANLQDGFSTTASIFTDFIGFLDYDSLFAAPPGLSGLIVIDTSTMAPLIPGVDYTAQPSTATDSSGKPISSYRSRVLIEPLKPLKPSTRYIVALTTALRSTDGRNATASDLFRVVRSATPVADSTEPILNQLSPGQKATLETLRTQLIRPVVVGLGGAGIPENALVLAWSFTTQSINNSLLAIEASATARPMAVRSTGLTLQNLNAAFPPNANVYAGTISLPYYLKTSGGDTHSTAPLTGYWLADASKPDTGRTFLGQVPCGAFVAPPPGSGFVPSESTTLCFPMPRKQADVTVPVLVTVPNTGAMPVGGWPVVIFQHGITGNRSQMLPLAGALSAAGFAVVAIDLPLHGITASDPSAGLRIDGIERNFDLDLVNNSTGAAGPDGVADSSGTHFINLSSLITSRDNLRQAEADLISLVKSLPSAVFVDTDGATPLPIALSATQRRFVGHSLGGIVGGTFLGVNADVSAATLAMPGGGIAKLLDGSASFGPRIAAGLQAQGVIEGTDNYETFLRFAQTLVDSADPINYAVAASTAHPIHMIEVVNDQVVPNHALARAAGAPVGDRVLLSGYLSGTEPLAALMGLSLRPAMDVPVTSPETLTGADANHVLVRFNQGDHGSILSPAASPLATQEMQHETAEFLRNDGACLPIGITSVCP